VKSFVLFLIAISVSISSFADEGFNVVQAKDNIYVIFSPMGGNVIVATGSDGTFLIDDQLASNSEVIKAAAEKIKDIDIQFILNTHYHFDHTGGNEYFGEEGAIIIAHDNVRKRLSSKQFISFFEKEMLPLSKAGLPKVTISNDMTLHYNDDEIRFKHIPNAHTDGDIVSYFTKANVIVTGDLVFSGMFPFIDIDHGGSVKGLIAGYDEMLSMADDKTVIIPGHGPIMDKAGLQAYRDMMAGVVKNIEAAISDGKTLEQTIAAKPTAEFDKQFSGGFIISDAITTFVYKSLKQ
jgi:cyclase